MFELVQYCEYCFVSIKFKHSLGKSPFVYTQVRDTARSEVANTSRIAPMETVARTAEKFYEEQRQEVHSLASNQKT